MQYVVNLIQIIRIKICIYLVDNLYINTTPSIHPFIHSFFHSMGSQFCSHTELLLPSKPLPPGKNGC